MVPGTDFRSFDRLRMSGNVRLAAREVGVAYSTLQTRRGRHAGFARQWEATVAAVDARLHLAGGKRGPESAARPLRSRWRPDPWRLKHLGRGPGPPARR